MNFDMLKRVFPKPVRFDPIPILFPRTGGPPQMFDEEWLVRVNDGPPRSADFSCLGYGYEVSLQGDSMQEYRSTGHVLLKVQMFVDRKGIRLHPLPDRRQVAVSSRLAQLASP